MNDFATAMIVRFWPFWLGWMVAFLAIEFTALALRLKYGDANHLGGTLSELVWWLIRGSAWYHRLILVLVGTFWIDLTLHFFVGTSLLL